MNEGAVVENNIAEEEQYINEHADSFAEIEILDADITVDEVLRAIKKLKK